MNGWIYLWCLGLDFSGTGEGSVDFTHDGDLSEYCNWFEGVGIDVALEVCLFVCGGETGVSDGSSKLVRFSFRALLRYIISRNRNSRRLT